MFKYSYFSYNILEWNKLDMQIKRLESFLPFKYSLLKTGQPISTKPNYNIHNHIVLIILTRLRLGLSHLSEYKFKHNFQDCVNPLCPCSLNVSSLSHLSQNWKFLINPAYPGGGTTKTQKMHSPAPLALPNYP